MADISDSGPLIDYIKEDLLDEDQDIQPGTSLFQDGLLDSMNLSSLILFIEQDYGVRIGPMDITYDTFDTVDRMMALIRSKSPS